MSTLFVNTIKPDSGSNLLISSSLTISESLKVAGDFELSGSIKLGNADTDSIGFVADVSSSILPDANETFDLGSTTKKWRHLHAVGITASGDISSSGIIIGNIGQFNELEFGAFANITASGDISTSGAFIGDGSQLSGIGISGSALDVINITSSGTISSSATGSFEHLVVSGDISGSVSASGTGSFQGGIDAAGATGSFGYISSSGNVSASGYVFSNNLVLPIDGTEDAKIVFAKNWTGDISAQKGNNGYIFDDDDSIQIGYADTDIIAIGQQDSINTDSDGMRIFLQTGVRVNGSVSASGTGSFQHGIDAAGATGSFGMISASGDISASGTGSFEHFTIAGEITSNVSSSGTGSFQGGIDCIGDGTGMAPATGAFGYISASGDISSSASGSFMHLSVSGSGSMTYLFVSASDQLNTAISASGGISASYFSGDGRHLENVTASFVAGGTTAAGSNTQLQFNDGGALGADAGLVYNKSTDVLSVSGSIIVGTNTPGLGHISASRVSASAGFEADTLSTSSFGFISCSGDISSSGTGSFEGGINCISPGGDGVDGTGSFGYISCSGDISISGDFFSTNITASGDISSSIIKGQQVQAQEGDNLGFRFNLNDNSQINAIRYKTIGERAHLQIPALPTSITLPFSASAAALVGGNLTVGGTATIAGTTTTNGTLNVASNFQIGGVAVTATAAELNKMDGFIGTTDQLNAFIKTTDEAIEASKAVKYDSDGAVRTKKVIKSSGVTLTAGDSDALLAPSGAAAQTFVLPAVADAKGVRFEFVAASAAAHIIQSEASDIFGQIIDNSNAATLARTELEGSSRIILQNPKIGDRITIISDGARYFVDGRTNDTPGLA